MKTKIFGIVVCMLMIAATTTIVSSKEKTLQGVIDQQQPNHDEIYWLVTPGDYWQSFTNKGHMLEKVQLHIGCYFHGSPDITLSIKENPTGPSLTQVTYQATDVPDNYQDWFTFDVPDYNLKINKIYYIVLHVDAGSEYAWSGAHGDPYPFGGSSHPDADWDSAFATMVDRSKTSELYTPFLFFLENHPHLFPILRYLLGLLIISVNPNQPTSESGTITVEE